MDNLSVVCWVVGSGVCWDNTPYCCVGHHFVMCGVCWDNTPYCCVGWSDVGVIVMWGTQYCRIVVWGINGALRFHLQCGVEACRTL